MTPVKKARKQQELEAMAFNVLASFRQQGGMPWTDWHQTTNAKRGGKRGLSTRTFSDVVKRLVANGRVRKDKNGCYEGIYSVETLAVAANSRDVATDQCWKAPFKAEIAALEAPLKAEIAALRAENKRLIDWIMGNSDALTCLQAVYQSPESSEYSKIKAATGALPFERPKLSVAVSVRGSDILGQCLDDAKPMKVINPPETIDHS
jgi:hypothetical protein